MRKESCVLATHPQRPHLIYRENIANRCTGSVTRKMKWGPSIAEKRFVWWAMLTSILSVPRLELVKVHLHDAHSLLLLQA
eukprot:scaffold2636_cov340-Pavlova_lutheri.AAC.138